MVKSEYWTIAYRKREASTTLLNNLGKAFTVIPNPKRYWCADPFVFTYQERTYLFAELYDNKPHRGVIGVCELTEEGSTEWRVVIREKHHLSYPFVFCWKDAVYMIPESYVANEITLYRAVDFPDKWERVRAVCEDFCTVDSTLFRHDERLYMLTQKQPEGSLMLFPMGNDYTISEAPIIAQTVPEQNRPAGQLFCQNDKLIRPAQDCSNGYGCALNFYEVDTVSNTEFSEHLIRKIYPNEIVSNHVPAPEGIHTYNFNEYYEVVDLKNYKAEPFWFLKRIYRALYWRCEKLFGAHK